MTLKKLSKKIGYVILGGIALLGIIALVLQNEKVQSYIIQKIIRYAEEKYHTEITLKKIRLSLTNAAILEEFLIKDQQKDTLLYAGEINLNFSGWRLHSLPELEGLQINKAYCQLKKDSLGKWNYNFLLNDSSEENISNPFNAFKKIALNHSRFKIEEDTHQTEVRTQYFFLNLEASDPDNHFISIKSLSSENFEIQYQEKKKSSTPPDASKDIKQLAQTFLQKIWNSNWNWTAKKIALENTKYTFINTDKNQESITGNIYLEDCNKYTNYIENNIKCNQVKIRNYIINEVTLSFFMDKNNVKINDFSIANKNGKIISDLHLHYEHLFDKEVNNFWHSIKGEGSIGIPNLQPIFLADYLDSVGQNYLPLNSNFTLLPTTFQFTDSSLRIDTLRIKQNKTEIFRTKIDLAFNPDFKNLQWTTDGLYVLISLKENPQLYKNHTAILDTTLLKKIDYLSLEGKAFGNKEKITSELNLISGIAHLKTEIDINKTPDSTYKIKMRYESYMNDYTLLPGNFSFASLNGMITAQQKKHTFNIEQHTTYINNFLYNNHFYKTITLSGTLIENIADGTIIVDDPAGKINIQYALNFQNPNDIFLLNESHIQHIDFKQIGVTKKTLSGQCKLHTSIHLTKEDSTQAGNITGNIELSDLTLHNDYGTYFLDKITCQSTEENKTKNIRIHSQELGDISLKGHYEWATIFQSLQHKFYELFPYTLVSEKEKNLPKNEFTAQIILKNFSAFNTLLNEHLSKLDSLNIRLSVVDSNSFMNLSTHSSIFEFKKFECSGIDINLQSQGEQIDIKSQLENLHYLDILDIQNLHIDNQNSDHILRIVSDKSKCTLEMGIGLLFAKTETRITLYPSTITLLDNAWKNESEGIITLTQNAVAIDNILLTNGTQQIILEAENKNNAYTSIHAMLKEVSLAPIQQFLNIPGFSIAGDANLNMYYTKIHKEKPHIQMDYALKNFILNGDSIGLLAGNFEYEKSKNIYNINSQTYNPEYDFSIYHKTNNKEASNENTLLNFDLRKVKAHILHFYTRSFFEDIGGYVKGNLALKEKEGRLFLQGKLSLDNASITIDYTQCTYHIQPTEVLFENEKILFQNITFEDVLNEKGQVDGYIKLPLSNLEKFEYNFQIQAENIVGLNTTSEDNETFYGRGIGKINLTTKGNIQNDSLLIYIQPGEKTLCNINLGGASGNEDNHKLKFIRKSFYQDSLKKNTNITPNKRQKNRTYVIRKEKVKKNNLFHMLVNINNAPKNIETNLIFDRSGANKINLRGSPHLTFQYDSKKGIGMNGKFDILDGTFLFALKDLPISKKFTIDPKYNNFISWTGNIENPNLNLKMNNRVEKVPFEGLESIAGSAAFGNTNTTPTPTSNEPNTGGSTTSTPASAAVSTNATSLVDLNVSIILTGTPKKMDLDFDINAINSNSLQNALVVNNYLQVIRRSPDLMRNQVSSLLLWGFFSNQTTGSNNTTNYTNQILSGAISGLSLAVNSLLFSEFNNTINDLINSKVVTLKLNYNSYQMSDLNTQAIRNQIGFDVYVKINNRLNLSLSPGVDFNLGTTHNANYVNTGASSSINFLPNANLKYDITKNGLITLNAFNAANYDNVIRSQRNRTGFSLLISKDFDIERKKKKKKDTTKTSNKKAKH